ncbi:FUSC family protein [Demequina sp.]|uniref:FUSC family protein n=1 Tax=Demequina sp. TaxID=2050685 RepID=UPI0025D28B8A|nr:FUSC family protein [Demequina sp.]
MTAGDRPRGARRRALAGGAGRAVSSLAVVRPAPGPRWPIGLQAAISVAVPVAVGGLTGHDQAGLLAASGAFTCLYVGGRRSVERVKVLPFIALALTLCAAAGTAAGPSPWIAGAGLVVITMLAAAAAYGFSLGPPGPLFAVLVYGLSAHVSGLADGHRLVPAGTVVGAVAAGCAFSCVVAASALILPSHRRGPVPTVREMLPGPRWDTEARELLARTAVVAIVGTAVSMAVVDPTRAYWTVSAGVAVIGARPGRGAAASRGLHRIVGTLVGAGLYLALASWVELPTLALALVLAALQFAVELVVVRHYALALAFITPLVLFITGAATGSPPSIEVVGERVLDTVVGGTLGALTGLLHRPPRRAEPPQP